MPKTKRRRCKAGCEPAAPRGPRDQRVPSCPCSPAASRVPARSWGAGDPETPRDRSKESATEAARRGAEGDTRGSEKGRRARGGASPCFPLLSSHVAPSAPFPQTRLQTPDAATHSAPPARGPGTPRNRGRSGRDGKGRRKMPDPRPSSPQVPSAGGEGDGAPPGVPPQDTSGHLRTVSQRSFGGANALPHSTERGRVCDRHGNVGINRGFSKLPGSKKFQTNCKGVNVLKYIIKFKPYYN